jgi:hypothetical protein
MASIRVGTRSRKSCATSPFCHLTVLASQDEFLCTRTNTRMIIFLQCNQKLGGGPTPPGIVKSPVSFLHECPALVICDFLGGKKL